MSWCRHHSRASAGVLSCWQRDDMSSDVWWSPHMQARSSQLSPLNSPGRVAARLSPCATSVDAADGYNPDDCDPSRWVSWRSRDEVALPLRTGIIYANQSQLRRTQVLRPAASVTQSVRCAAPWGRMWPGMSLRWTGVVWS